jgi:hypothetical protein
MGDVPFFWNMVSTLEKYLEEYGKIIVFDCISLQDQMFVRFFDFVGKQALQEKILIMVNGYEGGSLEGTGNADVVFLQGQEYDSFLRLYTMYEFSDQIILVSDNASYPGLFHYLRTGLMEEREIFEAILK